MGSLGQEEEEEEVQLHKHHLYKMSLQILAVDMVSLHCNFYKINFSASLSLSLQQAFRSLSRNSQGAGGRNGVELPEGGTPNIAHSLQFRFRAF